MGRSENSRNRIFEATEDGIRTKAFDESKMTDPSLIIYHPVRALEDGTVIVTNGDQTDTIRDHILDGHCYRHALNTREFEPDGPPTTPPASPACSSPTTPTTCPSSRAWTGTPPAAAGTTTSMTTQGRGGPLHPHLPGERRAPALL